MNNLYIEIPSFEPRLEIICEDSRIKNYLYHMFCPYSGWEPKDNEYVKLDFYKYGIPPEIVVSKSGEDAKKAGNVVQYIESYLLYHAYSKEKSVMLHGCAVERNGFSAAFLGDSTVGKSTLVTYLSLNEFRYITDDRIIIDSHQRLQPFPKTVMLRETAVNLLKDVYNINLPTTKFKQQQAVRFLYSPLNSCTKACEIKCIYILQRDPKITMPQIIDIASEQRIKFLLRYSLTPKDPNRIKNTLPLCAIPMAYLRYSSLESVISLLEEEFT